MHIKHPLSSFHIVCWAWTFPSTNWESVHAVICHQRHKTIRKSLFFQHPPEFSLRGESIWNNHYYAANHLEDTTNPHRLSVEHYFLSFIVHLDYWNVGNFAVWLERLQRVSQGGPGWDQIQRRPEKTENNVTLRSVQIHALLLETMSTLGLGCASSPRM